MLLAVFYIFLVGLLFLLIFSITSCANRAQLATAWSTRDTCTVCGHPTMSNYFTMYKIVAVLAFTYCSGYHCYYLSNYKLGVHVYCLWPPHSYELGVHMYCLWPLLFVCPTIVLVCLVYTTPITLVNCTPTSQLPIHVSYNSVSVYYFYYYMLKMYLPPGESPDDCLSLKAETNFFRLLS